MQYTLKNNIIKIDNGDHYYTGEVNDYMFPEEIRDNYVEIINQSFENFSDDKTSITLTNNFDDDNCQITIEFQYKVKPFSFKRSIVIPVFYHLKDFKDYTNERIEKLENEISSLKELITVLMEEKNNNSNKIDDEEEEEEEEEDEEEEDEEEEEERPIELVIPVKKTTRTVVQTKNGKQLIRNN